MARQPQNLELETAQCIMSWSDTKTVSNDYYDPHHHSHNHNNYYHEWNNINCINLCAAMREILPLGDITRGCDIEVMMIMCVQIGFK